jgi:gliding motility-associated-like protein
MKALKKIKNCLLVAAILFYGHTKACSPLTTPPPGSPGYSFQIVGNNILLNLSSTSTWFGCPYNFFVEIVCNGGTFPGFAPYYYTSPNFTQNSNPQAVPQMTIPIGSLCAGGVYQIRWMQNSGGAWSTPVSFTAPGIPIPTTLSVTANPTAICWPQTSQFTSTIAGGCGGGGGAIGYTWTPATGLSCVNCPSPVANPTTTTTYTLLVSGSGPSSCWSASTQITLVSFTAFPTVGTASAIPQLCEGQSNQISISSSSGSRQWEFSTSGGGPWNPIPGATGTTINTPPLTPGNYCYRLVTSGCGGSTTGSAVCSVVYPNPTLSISGASICAGATVNLQAVGAPTVIWGTGIGQTGPTTGTANPPVTTNYTVMGIANNCSNTAAFDITVVPYPLVNVNSNSPICINGTINLTSTGTGSVVWGGPNNFYSTNPNPSITPAHPAMNGVYTVSVTTVNCMSTGTTMVTVLNPSVSATNNGVYCANSNVQLFSFPSLGITSFQWSGPGFSSAAQNPTVNNIQVGGSGEYTVMVSDGFCQAFATTTVAVNPLPNPQLSSNGPICELDTLVLTASGTDFYEIYGPPPVSFSTSISTGTILNTPFLAAGFYTVIGTDVNGCVNKFLHNVVILPLPPLNVKGGQACVGSTASLVASGAASYSWTGPNGFTSSQNIIYFPNMQPSMTGSYVVTGVGNNGCQLTSGTTLTVFPTPAPSVSITQEVCLGGKAVFASEGGYLYTWLGPNGFVSQDQTTTLTVNSTSASGVYTLGVIDINGCQGFVTSSLTVRPLPLATVNANVNDRCAPYCAKYTLNTENEISSAIWNMDNTGVEPGIELNFCFPNDGSRVLRTTYTDKYGCSNVATYTINVYPKPKADFHFGPGEPTENTPVQFEDASLGPNLYKWEWHFEGATAPVFTKNPEFTYLKPGSYPVAMIVENKWGCKDTIIKGVTVAEDFYLYIPNAFTPNGDNNNDVFQPKGIGIAKFKMEIFDRWGERIFTSEELSTPWDGSVKGKAVVKEEVFVYKISVVNGKGTTREFTGHVSILK